MLDYAAARPRLQRRAQRAAAPLYAPPGYEKHHWAYTREAWTDVLAMPREMHHRLHSFLVYVPEAMCFRTLTGELLDTREKHVEYMVRVLRLPRKERG